MDYDTTIKNLIQILKFKSSDNLKQIEELWDAVSSGGTSSNSSASLTSSLSVTHTTTHNSCSSSSKLDESETQHMSEDSRSSSTNESSSNNSTNTSSTSLKRSQPIVTTSQKSKKLKISSPNESNEDTMDYSNSNTTTTNIDEYVIEMGLTCDTCKLLTQETNNKLVECQECKHMYHQKCHRPIITSEEIQDPRMLWFCVKCSKSVKKIVNKSNASLKAQLKRQNSSSNESNQAQHTPPTDTSTTHENSLNLSFFKRENTKNSQQSLESLNNSSRGMKGLASLASKFNTHVVTSENDSKMMINHNSSNQFKASPLANNTKQNATSGCMPLNSVKQRIIANQPSTTLLTTHTTTSLNEKSKQAISQMRSASNITASTKSKIT